MQKKRNRRTIDVGKRPGAAVISVAKAEQMRAVPKLGKVGGWICLTKSHSKIISREGPPRANHQALAAGASP